MKKLYKCEFCDTVYNTKKEATECENHCYKIEEITNYCIIKFMHPRLKRMKWYKDIFEDKERLLYLMEEYLYNEDRDYLKEESEDTEMFEMFGKLLPFIWN